MVKQHFLSGRKHCIIEADLTPKGVNNLLRSPLLLITLQKPCLCLSNPNSLCDHNCLILSQQTRNLSGTCNIPTLEPKLANQ